MCGFKFDDYKVFLFVIGCLVVMCMFMIVFVVFFVWYVRFVVNNKTIIEYYEGVRSRYNNIFIVVEYLYLFGLFVNL